MKKNNQKGFTLIELIVVMVIIGMLAAFMAFNFIEVNKRARDSQRKSDLQEIRSALELYRSDDPNGAYLKNSKNGNGDYGVVMPCGDSANSPLKNTAGTTYMQKVPCDPNTSTAWNGGNYYYVNPIDSSADPTNPDNLRKYYLIACLENNVQPTPFPTVNPALPLPPGLCPSNNYYVLTNP